MNIKNVVNFIFELGQLKKQARTGWWLAGVKDPSSVAEHTLRAAQIGYILAVMEGADPEKVASILIMHDNAETRIGDQNKVAARYIDADEGRHLALNDQAENVGEETGEKLKQYFNEFEKRNTREGIIARDADWLEAAFQAKEYVDLGYSSAQDWIDNMEIAIETESAKKLLAEMKKAKFTDWWKDLKKMTYEKLK
jgi:putative hydrolases of HD superfamily